MAGSKEIAVNYAKLLSDLCSWSRPDKYVQSAMAREFWRLPEQNAGSVTQNTTA
jgi:CRISPR type I-E-associated protein CasB/Cse2